MTLSRLYEPDAYAPDMPPSYWRTTVANVPAHAPLGETLRTEVAVIGAGFTGLNAALEAAEAGRDVVLIDAAQPGWGASGRNGGFACMGGAKMGAEAMRRHYGAAAQGEWAAHEEAAVAQVDANLAAYGIDADRTGGGELCLAHSARAFARKARGADPAEVIQRDALRDHGVHGPRFHGGLLCPTGFSLNPLKYTLGLSAAAVDRGVRIFGATPALRLQAEGRGWRIETPRGAVIADRVVAGANGYVDDTLLPPLAGTALPVISAILVTREMTDAVFAAQGWTSTVMAYDTRNLLHYFRRLPDNRFLFGMRGATAATPGAITRMASAQRRKFAAMFPAWAGVETPFHWWGLACVTLRRTPYCGPVPDMPGVSCAFGYHGNGVSAGTMAGRMLGRLACGGAVEETVPRVMRDLPARFPFPALRRWWLRAAYAGYAVRDRLS